MRIEDALAHHLGHSCLLVWLFEGYVLENDFGGWVVVFLVVVVEFFFNYFIALSSLV